MAPRTPVPEATVSNPPADPMREAEANRASLIDQMRDELNSQPKVEVKVKNDADVPVQINGYTYLIQPNVKVRVPQSVATLLEEAGYI